VPTTYQRPRREMVGTLRFAHPTAHRLWLPHNRTAAKTA